MSVTATDFPFIAPSEPEPEPTGLQDVDPRYVGLMPGGQGHTGPVTFAVVRTAVSRARPTSGALTVTQSGAEVLVSDLLGAVYGVGRSHDEALADYWRALDTHLAFLRAREGVLHPRLRRELEVLIRLFPGR